MPERRFQGPWRVDAPEPPGTEDYPGLVVCEGHRRGSIRTKERGLELWCWAYDAIVNGFDSAEADYDTGTTADEFARLVANLLNQRGEFGRLVCVLADVERWEVDMEEDHDQFVAWWQDRGQRARVRAALLECVAALDEEETEDE